jgi:hypothetical protein
MPIVKVVDGDWLYLTDCEVKARLAVIVVFVVVVDKFIVPLYLAIE